VPFSSTQTAPGLFRLALVLLRLSVLLVFLVLFSFFENPDPALDWY
jgi:hypothetical protein